MDFERRFVRTGVIFVVIGLLIGFLVPSSAAPRVMVAGHTATLLIGAVMIGIGPALKFLSPAPRAIPLSFWTMSYASAAQALGFVLAGLWGAAKVVPLAGSGLQGEPWQDAVTFFLISSSAVAALFGSAILLWTKASDLQ